MTLAGRCWIALALAAGPAILPAQVVKPRPATQPPPVTRDSAGRPRSMLPGRPGLPGVPRDTTAQDTTTFMPPDETMQALMGKPGYSVTRYEGRVVGFDATTNAFTVTGSADMRARVERDGQRVDTDSLIVYKDRLVDVTGRFRMDAGAGQPPVAGKGTATYDMALRKGRLTNAEVTMDESGARWIVDSEIGAIVQGDSARNIPTRFYGVGGTLTSCEDSIPDYHFRMREVKRTDRTLVARPAVMYIRDIPVMWFPFVFQDIRQGRRSGVLPPRFGISDIVRSSPNYRRHVENVGYYWAMSDYVDVATWLDWRSATGGDTLDPGWTKLSMEWNYNWLSRFLSGNLGASHEETGRGLANSKVHWRHQQRFGDRNFSANLNYVTSTQLTRQNSFNTYQALSSIRSDFSYSDKIGPAALQVGGGRTQWPGRDQVDQNLPTVSLTTPALALFSWLVWTPKISYSESSRLHMDAPWQFSQKFIADSTGRLIRADSIDRSEVDRNLNFDTPIQIFGYNFSSGVRIRDWEKRYPSEHDVYLNADSAQRTTRVFPRTFGTTIDWNPTIAMPPLMRNRFKVTPSVSLTNVDSRPYWHRSYLTGGKFVSQSKRLSYALSASPTIFGLFPGFGPFSRIRHAVSPMVSYSISPRAHISDEYLAAVGEIRQRYLGTLPSSAISFGLSQSFEAKVRTPLDTNAQGADGAESKLKLLSMQFSPLTYDFERAKATGRKIAGVTSQTFNTRMTSDLLPGMDFSFDYSLFRGSTQTDTAEFEPYLTNVSTSVRFSQRENPFTVVGRLFARTSDQRGALARDSVDAERQSSFARQGSQPVAGQGAHSSQFLVPPPVEGWSANLGFTLSRSRPPRPGDRVLNYDPRVRCEPIKAVDPFAYSTCLTEPTDQPPPSLYGGALQIIGPPQINVSGDLRLRVTEKWSATWNSSFDFVRHEFASQIVTLQRDLHDWRALFGFTRASNGNFAFTFNIALKPQPDFKFDYSRASVRSQ